MKITNIEWNWCEQRIPNAFDNSRVTCISLTSSCLIHASHLARELTFLMEDRDKKRSERGAVIGQDAHVFMNRGLKNRVFCLAKFERTDCHAFIGKKLRIPCSLLLNIAQGESKEERDYGTCFVSGYEKGRFAVRMLPCDGHTGRIEYRPTLVQVRKWSCV